MTKTYISGAVLTIRRPGGETEETVNTAHARNGVIPPAVFAKMVAATKAAGRGDILAQRPNVLEVPLSLQRAEIAGKLADRAGAFPGSRAWTEGRELEVALAAFDAEHPEVVAQILADRAARTAAGVARALNMAD